MYSFFLNIILCGSIMLGTYTVSSQNFSTNQRTLALIGKATLKVIPDQSTVSVYIHAEQKTLGETIDEMDIQTKNVIKKINTLGFSKEHIKTSNYNLREKTIFKDKIRAKEGYVASQNVIITFPYAPKKLDKILTAFSESKERANLNFSFSISEEREKKVKDELLSLAIKEAKRKALIMAKAAQVSLGNIISLSYGSNRQVNQMPNYRTASYTNLADNKGSFTNMSLKEVNMSEQVSIQWEIK